MPTMSQSQSMSDVAHSAHSFIPGQDKHPEVNSEPVYIAPLLMWHLVYGFSDNFASRFPNPPPQLSPEPTHSSHNRHSQPSSFAASYDEVPPEDDYDDVDCHGRRRRGHAFTVPGDEVLQGYLDFDNEDALRFRSIRHRRFQVYFNFSMGFVTDVTNQSFLTVLREILADFGANSAYGRLTNLPNAAYNAWNTKGWHIHDPALRYIHRFLTYNYSGRNDTSAALSKVELFFLWCMQLGINVNLGFWFARAFERVIRTDRLLILEPYITRLTSRLFPLTFNSNEFTFAFSMDPLDARCLDSMGLLAGTPSPPHIVPPGTIMPRDGRVFLRRATQPTAPPAVHPPSAMQDEIHDMHDRLHSMEANISEVLSYLRPGSSHRGRDRDRH
ncbi:hypothetical protein V6N12_045248 [Hibiscus sabdariffa]|uniref:Aminotransferase-like plant mobile domain-containing protein n=1 Tax=Hibiscus sabdariffa TaxID=183260 RepID=A0ABR2G2E7_9ROSI